MNGKLTFTMIKPDAVSAGNIGSIIDIILTNGFKIKAMRLTQLSKNLAQEFYKIHENRPFYDELVQFMSSGPIVAAILEKENAVLAYRELIGTTNPNEAKEGSIRKLFGTAIQKNAVHGSDSDDNAVIESGFFFNKFEIF